MDRSDTIWGLSSSLVNGAELCASINGRLKEEKDPSVVEANAGTQRTKAKLASSADRTAERLTDAKETAARYRLSPYISSD